MLSGCQNQNQDNLIKAQNYLFEQKVAPKNVVIGTSLSCHLLSDSVNQLFNLSFNGSSIFDGLDIVLKSKQKPSRIFIETNYFFISKSELLSSQLYSPYSYFMAEHFKIFRWDNQPIGIFISNFNQIGYEIGQRHQRFVEKLKYKIGYRNTKTSPNNSLIFRYNLSEQVKFYSKFISKKDLNNKLRLLKFQLLKLQHYGVDVVFFEMPVHSSLINARLSLSIRRIFKSKVFEKYKFIPVDTIHNYITNDGIHLNEKDSYTYTNYFDSIYLNSY